MASALPPPNGDRQELLKVPDGRADTDPVSTPTTDPPGAGTSSEITSSMHALLDLVVGQVPGVLGAVVGSADGFSLAARLPSSATADAASVAAMSAALLGLANRLVESVAPEPSKVAELRSEGAHGYVFAVAHAATLTVLATPESDRTQVMAVGREITSGLLRLLRGTADV